MKAYSDRFTLQDKLDRLTWQHYTGDGDPAALKRKTARTRAAMRRLLRDTSLDGEDTPELRADLALAKVEVHPGVSRLRDIFDQDSADLAPDAVYDLLELCRLRNSEARKLGYASYPQMALCAQGLCDESDTSYRSVLRYLRQPTSQDIADLPEIPCIELYWVAVEAQYDSIHYQNYTPDDYRCCLQALLELKGVSDDARQMEIVIKDQPYASGVAFDLPEGDSRRAAILIRPRGLRSLFAVAHELGHALLYLHRSPLRSAIPAWLHEGYAHVLENDDQLMRAALRQFCSDETISELLAEHSRLLRADNCRIWASILIEDAIWTYADRDDLTEYDKIAAITHQCEHFYSQYLRTKYADPLKWALDTFRSVDPVYVHSYALAQRFAALMFEKPDEMPVLYDTSPAAIAAITVGIASGGRVFDATTYL